MPKDWLHQKAKKWAHKKICEWEAGNPAPPKPEPKPVMSSKEIFSVDNGFVVIDAKGLNTYIHTIVENKHHTVANLNLKQMRELIDVLTEASDAIVERNRWMQDNQQLADDYQKWHGHRSDEIENLMKQYLVIRAKSGN